MKFQIAKWAYGILDTTYRFIVLPHGRSSGTSENLIREIIRKCQITPNYFVILLRDYKSSADDSLLTSIRLLCDELGLDVHAPPTTRKITFLDTGATIQVAGTERNRTSLKGLLVLADLVFLEEAETLSKAAWIVIEPTTRKRGSKIIVNYNPVNRADFSWYLYENPWPNSYLKFLTHRDNPWNPPEVLASIAHAYAVNDIDMINTYEGNFKRTTGGVFLAQGFQKGICPGVPYLSKRSWDMNFSSNETADWTFGSFVSVFNGSIYISRMKRQHCTPDALVDLIFGTAESDGKEIEIVIEEPFGSGVEVQNKINRANAGRYRITWSPAQKSKLQRAIPFSIEHNQKNVFWDDTLDALTESEILSFVGDNKNGGYNDDSVDSLSQGFNSVSDYLDRSILTE